MKKLFILCLLALNLPVYGSLLPDEKNNVEIYQKCNPSVVNITATTLRRDFFFEIVPQQGAGSGALFSKEGYIVTNDHVVGNASKVEVTFFDKTTLPATVVGTDPDSDLAVIKVDMKGKSYGNLDFSAPRAVQVGQKALAIGNPFGLGGSLSVGIVSSVGRDIRSTTGRLIKDVLQTDAAINPGNSGGPLLNSQGQLIGINTQIVSASGGSDGVGFAISSETVKRVTEQLIQFGRVLRPDLGIEGVGLSSDLLAHFRIPSEVGVMITDMDPRGPAAKAGLKAANRELVIGFRRLPFGGDIIFRVDNTPIVTMRDLLDALVDKKVGDTVTLHYYRGKEKKMAAIKLPLPPEIRRKSL